MKSVAVLGAGHGGAAAAADFAASGLEVRLWNRSAATLAPFEAAGGVRYEGALGDGLAELETISDRLATVVDGADGIVVCVPALAHDQIAAELARVEPQVPVLLSPGHTGGALHMAAAMRAARVEPPPLAELSTLPYVCRKSAPDTVRVMARAGRLRTACLPGGEAALGFGRELYPHAEPEADVLATGLANVNLVLHPPGAVLGAAWIEATGGAYRFYAEGTTPGVARVMEGLDRERLALARAVGHELPPLAQEMARIGTVDAEAARAGDLRAAVAGGTANATIMAPDSLTHRYYREDFGYGLVPFLALAGIAGVEAPVAAALLRLGEQLTGEPLRDGGLGAARLGLTGLDLEGLLDAVRGRPALQGSSR